MSWVTQDCSQASVSLQTTFDLWLLSPQDRLFLPGQTSCSSSHPELAFPSNSPPTDGSLLTCFRMPFFLLLDLFLCCYHIWTILSPPSCLIPPKDGEHPQRKNQDPDGKKGRACEPSPEEPGLVWPGEEWLGVSHMSQAW